MKNTHLIWLLLIATTLASFALAEDSIQPWVIGLILVLTSLKGALIIDSFMELHGVHHLVRRAMHLYCPVLAIMIWGILQFQ
ncbi:cytochrome C oxidase subunit IV family protein [Pontibacterium sp.]|uniref:cytochrome C oxidase subunit IV family protein n=1 Tax=Pontibacterium sp. TaxID=2036026 RepID=UPI0035189D08